MQGKIKEFCTAGDLDRQDRIRCSSILFIVALVPSYSSYLIKLANLERQRASGMGDTQREQQLHEFLRPLVQEWQSHELTTALGSFRGFCDLLGLNGLSRYIVSRNLHQISDWPAHPLDEEGKTLQNQIQTSLEVRIYGPVPTCYTKIWQNLPLHPTKTLMSVSIEKVQYGSRAHKIACDLWSSVPPIILPNLLHFIRY